MAFELPRHNHCVLISISNPLSIGRIFGSPLIRGLQANLSPVNLRLCRRRRPLKSSQSDGSGHLHRFGTNLTAHDRYHVATATTAMFAV
jgi:hypothetical protein